MKKHTDLLPEELALPTLWKEFLADELKAVPMDSLLSFVDNEYNDHTCYPPKAKVFRALDICPPEAVRVVIIGQDPYHGPGQANGLAFSVEEGIDHPPSLKNIFKEIGSDLNKPYPDSGDLGKWASQGVLLLNATLSVRQGEAGSHQGKGWEALTDAVIKGLALRSEGLVFLLWGGFAKKKKKLIDQKRHYILESGHPSPLSANRGLWFGNRHFSKCNALLSEQGKTPIAW